MLTDAQIKKLKLPPSTQKAPDKYPFGNGLRLFVYANGKKIWFIDYRHDDKRRHHAMLNSNQSGMVSASMAKARLLGFV